MPLVMAACGSENRRPEVLPEWEVDDSPAVVIGADDRREGHDLYRVAGAARLSGGRIAIANGSSSEIRFFSPSGDLVRVAGGRGSGPAEFGYIDLLGRLSGDTLILMSIDAVGRVSGDGRVLSKEPVLWPSRVLTCRVTGYGSQEFVGAGRILILAEDNFIPGCAPLPSGAHTTSILLALYDWQTGVVDTIGVFPGTERTGREYRVYGRDFIAAVGGGRIFAVDTRTDSVHVFSAESKRQATWPLPWTAEPVPPSAAAVEAPVRNGVVLRQFAYDYPETYPLVARLLVDRVGWLWVMKYPPLLQPKASGQLRLPLFAYVPASGADWLVLDEDGRPTAHVHTPSRLFPLEIGEDYILGLRRDSLDVESVALHSLIRR